MKYTLIIPVYNRLSEVRELLKSVEDLNFNRSDFEVLFVDDGSDDGFREFIKSYRSNSELNIVTLFQENRGPGAARNFGMSEANGDYFIFVDSDCILPVTYLERIHQAVMENNYDAFGGPDTDHPSFSRLLKAINYSMTSFVGTGGTRGGKNQIGKFYPRSFNMGVSRKVYEQIGGMNHLRHGQDMDYSARIYNAGFEVGFIFDAFVYHKRRTSLSKFFRQIFNWGVARINLGVRHQSLLKPVHFLPAVLVAFYILILVLGLIFQGLRPILYLVLLGHLAVCVWAFLESFIKYKSIKISFLSIITLNMQVFAYGLGFLYALFQRAIGKQEAEGFVKNYYGKVGD
ncbi:glycosyltransferase [Membranihabitans maritimus]|uniref:glycosyltransferase n=1 Tax=Membranihabitans maritimus TaxID=2904244 RepID=UPI001F398990|nr:glycosyltransferase [Membranihabitans maritimus]